MRSVFAGFAGVVVGILVAVLATNFLMGPRGGSDVKPVPEIGGQPVPAEVIEIAFDQRYDIHTSIYGVEPLTFLNCKIVGFTGRLGESGASPSSSVMDSGSSSSYRDHFDHWLVLEQVDKRLLYIPPNSVKYIEQAAPQGP